MIVPLGHVLLLAALLFLTGLACVAARRNLFMIIIGVEVMLNAAGLALVAGSLYWQNLEGQALVLFVLSVAAAEVAVGLALAVRAHRRRRSLDPDDFRLLGN
ncbi:MAG: NADH-quinone oxidoreductase subunit NuoK [Deltaproteobacteria bacterium]|nr:NADH-quinone oxidoreductase subunit NuoK [Deltaproteobacteria bacterium]